jgi:hypothetical protein
MDYGLRFDSFKQFAKGGKANPTDVITRRLCLLDWILRHKFSTKLPLQTLLRFQTANGLARYLADQVRMGYIKKISNGMVVGRQLIMLTPLGVEYLQQYRDQDELHYSTDASKLPYTQLNHEVLIQVAVIERCYKQNSDVVDYMSELEFRAARYAEEYAEQLVIDGEKRAYEEDWIERTKHIEYREQPDGYSQKYVNGVSAGIDWGGGNDEDGEEYDYTPREVQKCKKFPDGIVTRGELRVALEVETHLKKPMRYDTIMRSHGLMMYRNEYDAVAYTVPSKAVANGVRKAIKAYGEIAPEHVIKMSVTVRKDMYEIVYGKRDASVEI